MLTKFQTYRKMGEAYGSWYWSRPGKFAEKDKAARVAFILEYRRYRKALAQGDYTLERNPRGNIVWRDADADFRATGRNRHGENRYYYDFGPLKTWEQYDTRQDAWYFGVWLDLVGMRTFTYAEGDRTLVECETLEAFKAELDDMASFYGEPPPVSVAVDDNGTATAIYCELPSLEIAHA